MQEHKAGLPFVVTSFRAPVTPGSVPAPPEQGDSAVATDPPSAWSQGCAQHPQPCCQVQPQRPTERHKSYRSPLT